MATITWKTNNKRFDEYTEFIAEAIQKHLNAFAETDPHFAECMKKENKNFDECMIYVINQVWKDKSNSPDEICYQNARHYYLEDNIDRKEFRVQLYNNSKDFDALPKPTPKPTKEDINEHDKEVLEEAGLLEKPKKKPVKKPAKKVEEVKEEVKVEPKKVPMKKPVKEKPTADGNVGFEQMNLFDLL